MYTYAHEWYKLSKKIFLPYIDKVINTWSYYERGERKKERERERECTV